MNMINRRQFVTLAGAAAASTALPAFAAPAAAPKPESFEFIFLTDCHIQPELDAIHGTSLAMTKARAVKADFAIQGGDHVFDSLAVPKSRAVALFDQYDRTEQELGLKVHHTIGNHDVCGIYTASGVPPDDPLYGKKLYESRFGKTFYSFDHKGYHFIVLDSIGITNDHNYEARIDQDQFEWLKSDLAASPAGTPIVVTTHIPLVTALASYGDPNPKVLAASYAFHGGPQVIKLFEGHNVLGVLQGHTHINERVDWRGVPYITSGAVCGNWWKGTRMGTPEGFTVVSLNNGKLSTRYEMTGFKSVAPENT